MGAGGEVWRNSFFVLLEFRICGGCDSTTAALGYEPQRGMKTALNRGGLVVSSWAFQTDRGLNVRTTSHPLHTQWLEELSFRRAAFCNSRSGNFRTAETVSAVLRWSRSWHDPKDRMVYTRAHSPRG